MGQIIIELPNRINRHYQITNREFADVLIKLLQTAAAPVKKNPIRLTAEDKADIRAARRARKEKGFITLEQLEAELNL
ncbi:hypothetical protein BH20ACI1_BH20ACI1_06840 [soil metagenome]